MNYNLQLGSLCIDKGNPDGQADPDGSRKDMGALPTYKTAPLITMTCPISSAQEVPRQTAVSAIFDMPMDPATITGDNFLISGQGGGRSGSISYDPLTHTATFTPDQPFDPGETVQAQMVNGISNLWGVAMAADYGWSFEITTSTGVETPQPGALPAQFALLQNYPNPFNAETQIRLSIPSSGQVDLRIYNMLGQLVKTLVDADLPAGDHQAVWNGTDDQGRALASGMYFYRLQAGGMSEVRRMVLLR